MPIGLASFVDRDHEYVVSWHECAVGGRYAAHQASDVLVADLRGFYCTQLADDAEPVA